MRDDTLTRIYRHEKDTQSSWTEGERESRLAPPPWQGYKNQRPAIDADLGADFSELVSKLKPGDTMVMTFPRGTQLEMDVIGRHGKLFAELDLSPWRDDR